MVIRNQHVFLGRLNLSLEPFRTRLQCFQVSSQTRVSSLLELPVTRSHIPCLQLCLQPPTVEMSVCIENTLLKWKGPVCCQGDCDVDKQNSHMTDDDCSCAWAHACVAPRACAVQCFYASVCADVNVRETHLPYSHVCSHAVQSHGDTDKRKSPLCWCTRAGSRRCPCCTHLCLWETHMQHITHVETAEKTGWREARGQAKEGSGGMRR